jgi:hypothetical protein
MNSSRYLIRLTWLLVLGALVVGTAVSLAGAGNSRPAAGDRIVDDYFRDPTPIVTPPGERIVDDYFRDPTPIVTPPGERIVDDYFRDPTTVAVPQSTGSRFDWGDWGIGLVAGFGLALGLAGALLLAMHRIPGARRTGAASAG